MQLREAETAARPREAEVAEGRSCGKSLQLSRLLCSKLYSSKFGPTMFCRRATEDCNWGEREEDEPVAAGMPRWTANAGVPPRTAAASPELLVMSSGQLCH